MSELIATAEIQCPYCGELLELSIDCTAGSQTYVEDCQVCCAPITLTVDIDNEGNFTSVTPRRDSD